MMFIRNFILFLLIGLLPACALGDATEITETVIPSITPINTQVTQTAQVTATTTTATATYTATARPTNTPVRQATSVGCTYDLTYVADISIPDGTVVVAGSTVTKTWRVRNTGTCSWTTAFSFQQIGGDAMSAPTIPGMFLAVGQTVDISALITVGTDIASYDDLERANFRMFTPNGVPFGDTLYAEIDIIVADRASCNHDVTVLTFPSIATLTVGDTGNASWVLQNTGDCPWENFQIVRPSDTSPLLTPNLPHSVPTVQVGETYAFSTSVTVPNGFGMPSITLNVQDNQGNVIAPLNYQVSISSNVDCEWDSDFVTDVTIPDGTVVTAGSTITKTWRLENSGTCNWHNFVFLMIDNPDDAFEWAGEYDVVIIPFVAVGDTMDITARLVVSDDIPDGETVSAQFQIRGVNDEFFGTMPYVEVEVSNP